MWENAKIAADFIRSRVQFEPDYGVVLGSGLGSFADDIIIDHVIPYAEIPHFPEATVQGHAGRLLFGKVGPKKVVAMQGRLHYYEGHTMQEVTFPIRVMKLLGVSKLLVSNASGGVNPRYTVGDIVVLKDHINLMPEHPLRGKNEERFGPRFVNMSEPYTLNLRHLAKLIAAEMELVVHEGVYLALQGPTFETLAEYKMVEILGADCVGMSTVPEVIVARHMNMDTFGISVITDMGNEKEIKTVSHSEVLEAAKAAEPKVRKLIKALIERS